MSAIYLLLVGLFLFAAALVGRKQLSWLRYAWMPGLLLVLVGVGWLLGTKQKENRQAKAFFSRLEQGPRLSNTEAETFRTLAQAPEVIRLKVLKLAFDSATNGTVAFPRWGFLLQSCLGADSTPEPAKRFWRKVVEPVLKQKPTIESIRLAAATVDFLRLGSNEAAQVTGPLLKIVQGEPDPAMQGVLLMELTPLADRMSPAELEALAQLVISRLDQETNPSQTSTLTATLIFAAKHLSPGAAQRHVSQALQVAEQNTNNPKGLSIVRALTALTNQMTPDQLQRTVEVLALAWLDGDGRPQAGVPEMLGGFVQGLPVEQVENLVKTFLGCVVRYSYDRNYQHWAKAASPFLSQAGARMGSAVVRRIVSEHLQPVREPWSDLMWGGLMRPLLEGAEPEDVELLARDLLDKVTGRGRGSEWYISRFSAVASRLKPDQSLHLLEGLLAKFFDPEEGTGALTPYCMALAERLDEAGANAVGGCLVTALNQANGARFISIAKIIGSMGNRLDSDLAEQAITIEVLAILRGKNIYRSSLIAEQLAAFAKRMSPEVASLVIDRLIAAIETTDIDGVRIMLPGLATMTDQMNELQGVRTGEQILHALQINPIQLFAQKKAVERLAGRMNAGQARRAVELLLARGSVGSGPEIHWLYKVPVVAAELSVDAAESFASDLTATLPRQRDVGAICLRVRTTVQFADKMRVEDLRGLGERLMQIIEADTNSLPFSRLLTGKVKPPIVEGSSPRTLIAREESLVENWGLRTVCEALELVLPKLPEPDAAELAGRLAARCVDQGWVGPIPFDGHLAAALQYASEERLLQILRTPFAVGGIKRTVLRALELKSGGAVEGSLWAAASPRLESD